MGASVVVFYTELHSHTYPASSDSWFTPESIVRRARDVGLDGIVISNHYDYFQLNRQEGTFYDKVKGWLSDVTEAKEYGERYGVKVFCGLEYSVDPTIHFGVIGLTEEILLNNPPEPDSSVQYLMAWARESKVLLVENHPFRPGYKFCPLLGIGYELYNTKYSGVFEQAQELLSATQGIDTLYVCGADAHWEENLGLSAIVFHKAPINERDLLKKLRNKEYSMALNVDGTKSIREVSLTTL